MCHVTISFRWFIVYRIFEGRNPNFPVPCMQKNLKISGVRTANGRSYFFFSGAHFRRKPWDKSPQSLITASNINITVIKSMLLQGTEIN